MGGTRVGVGAVGWAAPVTGWTRVGWAHALEWAVGRRVARRQWEATDGWKASRRSR